MSIALDVLVLIGIIAFIVVACEIFTNSIEWLGKLLNLNEGAVGSILAAVGTALPETIVPIIAIAGAAMSGSTQGAKIAEGAIVGAPFMLATLAMFITGTAVFVFVRQGLRTAEMPVATTVLGRDLKTFLLVFGCGVLASFLPPWQFVGSVSIRHLIGIFLLAVYGWYVWRTLSTPGELVEDVSPLYFGRKHLRPPMFRVVFQVVVSLGLIVVGAHFFIGRIEHLSHSLHIAPLILSLLITPIATELPEKMNSVLWIRAKKDTLALGNLTGAMVFQSCIPVAVGLWLTPWVLSKASLLSATLAMAAAVVLIVAMRQMGKLTPYVLLSGGGFYALFVLGLWQFRLW